MNKSLFYAALSILLFFNLSAQIGLTNMSVSEENAKYFYRGGVNQLYLNNIDASSQYEVKIGELSLLKTDLAQFTYNGPFEKETKFDIYENGQLIKSEIFPGRRIADSEIRFGNILAVTVSKSELLENPTLTLFSGDTYIENEYIAEFLLTIFDADGQTKHQFEKVKGCNYSPEQIGLFSVLCAGDRLEVHEVVVVDSSGISRVKGPVSILVK